MSNNSGIIFLRWVWMCSGGATLHVYVHPLGIVKIFSGVAVICEIQELILAAELLLFCG